MDAPLDQHVAPLVEALNAVGLRTTASCHGHGVPIRLPPFVAFAASEADASRLSRAVRDDAVSDRPTLRRGWRVDAGFDERHRLIFRLTTENPHRRIYRWSRRSLDRDFLTLVGLVERAMQQV